MPEDDSYLTDDAAAYIRGNYPRRCSSGYLTKLRSQGKGPPFYRRNGQVVYQRADLDKWAANPKVIGPFRKSSEARKSRNNDPAASIDCEVA